MGYLRTSKDQTKWETKTMKVTEQGEGKPGAGNLDQNTTHDGVGLGPLTCTEGEYPCTRDSVAVC